MPNTPDEKLSVIRRQIGELKAQEQDLVAEQKEREVQKKAQRWLEIGAAVEARTGKINLDAWNEYLDQYDTYIKKKCTEAITKPENEFARVDEITATVKESAEEPLENETEGISFPNTEIEVDRLFVEEQKDEEDAPVIPEKAENCEEEFPEKHNLAEEENIGTIDSGEKEVLTYIQDLIENGHPEPRAEAPLRYLQESFADSFKERFAGHPVTKADAADYIEGYKKKADRVAAGEYLSDIESEGDEQSCDLEAQT